jgi:hypothetical protein
MYIFILFFIVLLIILFLVYKFFPKLDYFLKQYLPSQRVINIKTEMHNLDKSDMNSKIDKQKTQEIFKKMEKINNIPFLLIDYFNKLVFSFFPSLGR